MRSLLLSVALAACSSTPVESPPLDPPKAIHLGAEGVVPTCDADLLTASLEALGPAPSELRTDLGITAIGEACDPDLAALTRTDAGPTATPDYVARHQAVWKLACPAGMNAFGALVTKAPPERVSHLHAACELERYGWSLDDARGLRDDLLPAIIAAGLVQDRPESERTRWYALLAGH